MSPLVWILFIYLLTSNIPLDADNINTPKKQTKYLDLVSHKIKNKNSTRYWKQRSLIIYQTSIGFITIINSLHSEIAFKKLLSSKVEYRDIAESTN